MEKETLKVISQKLTKNKNYEKKINNLNRNFGPNRNWNGSLVASG